MIAIVLFNSIAIYRASSGTMIAYRTWEYSDERLCDPQFIHGGSQMILRLFGQEKCFILNTSNFSFEAIFLLPQMSTAAPYQEGSDQTFYTFFGSKLDLLTLENCEIREDIRGMEPWSVDARPSCDETCKERLSPISNLKEIYSSSSQLQFKVTLKPGPITNILGRMDHGQPFVVLSIYTANWSLIQTIVIPPYKDSHDRTPTSTHYIDAVLLADPPRMAVISERLLMIWRLPEDPGRGISLDIAWSFPDERKREWKSCIHNQLYFLLSNEKPPQHVGPVFSGETTEHALRGVMELIKIHQVADTDIRNAILQYIGSIINNHPDSKNRVLYHICNTWSEDGSNSIEQFVEALFVSEYGRWLPNTDIDQHKIL
ncbi:hypothetical protein BGX27_004917, partial [Mortierella sp. AM989]